MKCRFCNHNLYTDFLDLGFAPPSNAYLSEQKLYQPENTFPLRVKVCTNCWLVQTEDYNFAEDLFDSNYAYFSSTSSTFLHHARSYANKMEDFLNLNEKSFVVEIASNDGYLLKNFLEKDIPCLGVEPTKSTADASRELGIPNLIDFFSSDLSTKIVDEYKNADLIIGNNVYAHVPDINDFTAGMKILLGEDGVITLEFPHLLELIKFYQFDTVYHEHFSYLSLHSVNTIFEMHDLKIFDVEKLGTHGGSLRIYGCHSHDSRDICENVSKILREEDSFGLFEEKTYSDFQKRADQVKDDLLNFLIKAKSQGKRVIGYGAAAKGNTLLNYAGIKKDLLPVICDAASSKQNKYMPGSHIPIKNPEDIDFEKVDYVLILPWNISKEIQDQISPKLNKNTNFVTAGPQLEIFK